VVMISLLLVQPKKLKPALQPKRCLSKLKLTLWLKKKAATKPSTILQKAVLLGGLLFLARMN
jgi:hypothetical protein